MHEERISEGISAQMMNIVSCADQNYLPHLSVTIRSLLAYHKADEMQVYLVLNNCTESQLEIFLGSILPVKPFVIHDTKISAMPFFVDRHISITTYQRIFLDYLLPEKVYKFIYLDCDIVITGSLKELWNLSLEQNIIAAAPDFNEINFIERNSPFSAHFNAGVLIVNRSLWKLNNITQKLEAFIIANGSKLEAWDQDALNFILSNSWKKIDIKWNLSSKFFQYRKQLCKFGFESFFYNAAIIHFSASIKPWHYRLRHPYKHLYFHFLPDVYKKHFKYPDRNHYTIFRKKVAELLVWMRLKAF
jgi:lipopolysaccharide biosynthesis glycosyltransferase